MGSFRVLVERQRADPIAAEFLSVASSAIRLRALRFSPLLPITIAPHHHENVRFRAARHLRYVRFGVKTGKAQNEQMFSGLPPKADHRIDEYTSQGPHAAILHGRSRQEAEVA